MKKKLLVLALCVIAQGCTKIDDYMLGKDNSPKPKQLVDLKEARHVQQKWTVAVGKATKSKEYLRLKPIVKEGVVYTADASGLVHAVNQKDGSLKWTTQISQDLVSGPSLGNGYLAVGTSHSALVILDQKTGRTLWQTKVSGEVLAPPTIAQNKVIAKTIDGKVFAYNAVDGKELWHVEHGSPHLVLKASSSPVILGNLVLIGFSDGKLDALDIQTGRLIWQQSIAYASGSSDVERLVDIDADPIVENNIAYLASYQGYIGALSLADGQFVWKKPSSVYKNMRLKGDTLYVSDSNDVLWSINKLNGHVNWKQQALKARGITEPVLVGKDLVVGDKTGYLHFIDTQTGEFISRFKTSSGVTSSPSVSGRQLYVLTDNGMLNQLSVS